MPPDEAGHGPAAAQEPWRDGEVCRPWSEDRGRALAPGEVVAGRYVVDAQLGDGAFSEVFTAWDGQPGSSCRVALKRLRPAHAMNARSLHRFEHRELALLVRVSAAGPAPNVVCPRSDGLVWHEGLPLMVLELVEGPSLRASMDRSRSLRLPVDTVGRIALGLAQGLAAIHAVGGIHRDLKPSNVRLRGDGSPVILDLGIAKALWDEQDTTTSAPAWMTHRYAAPEQLDRAPVSAACDVYALGLILHEMLDGKVPLAGATFASTRALRLGEDGRPSSPTGRGLADALARIASACLARCPARRPTANEVAVAIEAALAPERGRRARLLKAVPLLAAGLLGGACSGVTASSPSGGVDAFYPLGEALRVEVGDVAIGQGGAERYGPSPVPGRRGALHFDGESDFVEVPSGEALDVGRGDFSIAAWIRTNARGQTSVLVDKRDEHEGRVRGFSFYLQQGNLGVQLADRDRATKCVGSSCWAYSNYRSSGFVADGAWHHVVVAIRRNEIDGGVFYIDGRPAGAFDPTDRPRSLDSEAPLRVGRRSSSEGGFFAGDLADVALYRRQLSEAEVVDLFLKSPPPSS
ncbi:protein kinase domain-containing protein [Chondromyces crocatus]|uniref:Protein kinase domain-containing protein n=1 Tax=Chondromyces crocatus TaxID=52 RepID=A0A0K1EN83_CHOCO|nr:protein kinase [Chondromyces crocatus]AKT42063.1 uncharacterized protein CMC5_062860 [Chondromyces crocatus]